MSAPARKRNRARSAGESRRWSAWSGALTAHLRPVLSVFALVLTGVLTVSGLTWALNRPIAQIEVGGSFQRVAPTEIEAAVAPFRGVGFLSVDLEKMQAALEAIAWVDRARVERRWANGVRVLITEHVPAARWGEAGLMNTRGELFLRGARHIPAELPQLNGPDGTEGQVARLYLETYPKLLAVGMRLARVELDARGAWELELANGVRVRLGRQDVATRLERFIRVASPMIAARSGEVSHVDLRYSNGFSVGWNPPATRVARDAENATPDA